MREPTLDLTQEPLRYDAERIAALEDRVVGGGSVARAELPLLMTHFTSLDGVPKVERAFDLGVIHQHVAYSGLTPPYYDNPDPPFYSLPEPGNLWQVEAEWQAADVVVADVQSFVDGDGHTIVITSTNTTAHVTASYCNSIGDGAVNFFGGPLQDAVFVPAPATYVSVGGAVDPGTYPFPNRSSWPPASMFAKVRLHRDADGAKGAVWISGADDDRVFEGAGQHLWAYLPEWGRFFVQWDYFSHRVVTTNNGVEVSNVLHNYLWGDPDQIRAAHVADLGWAHGVQADGATLIGGNDATGNYTISGAFPLFNTTLA